MSARQLHRTVASIADAPFHALVTPEDGVVRAAGFATPADPQASSLLARLIERDPEYASYEIVDAPSDVASNRAGTGSVTAALHAYAAGEHRALDSIRVKQAATPFRGEVWRALREVPPGASVTYTELATLAGRPTAVRAAASACANNLIALIVPCHRIVRTDGGLGGYLFGTELKRQLLEHEAQLRR